MTFKQKWITETTNKEQAAAEFAKNAHNGTTRKFDGKPYFVHPERVAKNVYQLTHNIILTQAAYLHDVIEDTKYTYQDILNQFGKEVADLVQELTSDETQLNNLGKTPYLIQKMNHMSADALTIKLLDRLDNVGDFDTAPITWAIKYAKQTQDILNNLNTTNSLHRQIINRIQTKINGVLSMQ